MLVQGGFWSLTAHRIWRLAGKVLAVMYPSPYNINRLNIGAELESPKLSPSK